MNNHIVLPRVLVDNLTSALLATAAQLEHFAGPAISAVNQSVIDKATDALEATRHHLNHPDNAGDRLRFATRLLQAARPGELAALDNRECFELAERVAWWRDQAEARLTTPSLRKLADQIRESGAPERIIQAIRDAGAEDDRAVLDTLEDGEALRSLGIDDQAAVEDAHASLQAPAAERLASLIDAELRDRGIRHYVDAIEPGDGEAVLWPYGRPVTSVRDAIEFVTEAARS